MSVRTVVTSRWAKANPFSLLPRTDWTAQKATHRDAAPTVIESALKRSAARPSGNWFSFAASDDVGDRAPFGATVAGNEIVAWRSTDGTLRVGPGSCPHLGADLSTGALDCGTLICPWHGMRLSGRRQLGWTPYPAYDDGVLAWVRLDHVGGEKPTMTPVLPDRPDGARLHAVTRMVGTCEVADIIANRLDPWHGAWFHPHSFARLDVLSAPPAGTTTADADRFLVSVTFHVGRVGVPVVAEFTSPERRTIVMRIVDGEGTGSLVETHATPLGVDDAGRPLTMVTEATIAYSNRPGFSVARSMAPLLKPSIRRTARKLWVDDLAYAERRYELRQRGEFPD
jgi:hypothetical protein